MSYKGLYSTQNTPQTQPVPGRHMVRNDAGGYVFPVDKWMRLRRFLILGSDSPTYYASAAKLTMENAAVVNECLAEDYTATIDKIVAVSVSGAAPKNDSALFALALAASNQNDKARVYALSHLNQVARTGEHLFQFISYADELRGHGRAYNRALKNWYLEREPKDLAYQILKYRQRHNWTHRNVLRMAKPRTDSLLHNAIFQWITKGYISDELVDNIGTQALMQVSQIYAHEQAKNASESELIDLILKWNLTHEMVPTEMLNRPKVNHALLQGMPITATIRNLGRLTANGSLSDRYPNIVEMVADRIVDGERLRRGRVHPMAILAALKTYQSGKGARGSLSWTPINRIVDALDKAFYLAFDAVEPTGRHIMLALDISSSMNTQDIAGMIGITPRIATAAMAMITLASEHRASAFGFSTKFIPLDITSRRRLDDVVRYMNGIRFGGTDCALPMIYAANNHLHVDAFVIYTDNETWAGRRHPFQALEAYRRQTQIPAKLIVVGMTATRSSIGNQDDAGTLDVVGFDTAAPKLISDFIRS